MAKLIEDPDGQVDPNHTVVLVLTEYELLTIASLVGNVNTKAYDAHHDAVREIWRAIMYKHGYSGDLDEARYEKVLSEHHVDKEMPLKFRGEYK